MRSFAPIFITVAVLFSWNGNAQRNQHIKIKNMQAALDEAPGEDLAVLYYHVEERINMNFGSSVTTYDVSSLNLVSNRDLGENNTRIITPKYGKSKAKVVAVNLKPQSAVVAQTEKPKSLVQLVQPVNLVVSNKKLKYVEIDVIGTYERVLDKGYQSIDMLKKVGNSRFYGGDLQKAAKYYTQLFSMTKDLEAEYYYRYSQALFSIQETEKAKEMLKMFESMTL